MKIDHKTPLNTLASALLGLTLCSMPMLAAADSMTNGLKILMPNKPKHLNSALASGTHTGVPAAQLFTSLLKVDRSWNLSPYLAESWETSADGLSITFNLTPGAVFHDGEPIESDDVAFSILTVRDNHPFSSMLKSVESVETPSPLTAIVKLKYASLVVELAAASPMLPILPKHVYDNGEPIATHPANTAVIGSGPFRLVEQTGQGLVMEKFEDFFVPDRPHLDRLEFHYLAESDTSPSFDTETNLVRGFLSDVLIANKLNRLPGYQADFFGYSGVGPVRMMMFNLRKEPMNSLLVRKALAHAVDTDYITREVFLGRAFDANTAIHPENPHYYGAVEHYPYDMVLANQMLDEAGYPRQSNGIRFKIDMEAGAAPAGSHYFDTTEFLKEQWRDKLGVDLNVVTTDSFREYAGRMSNYQFDLAFINYFNWGDPVIGVDRLFLSENIRKGVMFSNLSGYSDSDVDAWIKSAQREHREREKRRFYRLVQTRVAESLPIYPTSTLAFSTIFPSRLVGMDRSIWGNMFAFDEVYWRP